MKNIKTYLLVGALIIISVIFYEIVLKNDSRSLAPEEEHFLDQQNSPQDYDKNLFK